MGASSLIDFDGHASLDATVSWHLSSNCYPPIPQVHVPTAVQAVEACREGDYDRLIDLPAGVEHVRYGTQVPASVYVDSLRLDAIAYTDD